MKPSATPWPTNKSFLRSPQTLRSPPNRPPSSPSPSRTKPTAFGRKTAFAVANPSENSSTLAEKACTRPSPPLSLLEPTASTQKRSFIETKSPSTRTALSSSPSSPAKSARASSTSAKSTRGSSGSTTTGTRCTESTTTLPRGIAGGRKTWRINATSDRSVRSPRFFKRSPAVDGARDAKPDVDHGGGGIGDAARRIERE